MQLLSEIVESVKPQGRWLLLPVAVALAGCGDATTVPYRAEAADARHDASRPGEAGPAAAFVDGAVAEGRGVCDQAEPLPLASGKGAVKGRIEPTAGNHLRLPARGCTGDETRGADRFYAVDPTPDGRYRVRVVPAPSYDVALLVLGDCLDPHSCVTGVDRGLEGEPEQVVVASDEGRRFFVGISSRHMAGDTYATGDYEISVERLLPPDNDRCSGAVALDVVDGQVSVTGDTSGASDTIDLPEDGCTGQPSSGPDVFYRVILNAGVTYRLTLDSPGFNGALYLQRSCSDSPGCGDKMGSDDRVALPEVLLFAPETNGEYLVVVDGRTAHDAGTFSLAIEAFAAAANDACEEAELLVLEDGAVERSGQTVGATSSVSLSSTHCTGQATDGPDVFYRVQIDPESAYAFTLDAGGFDASLYLFSSCDAIAATCGSGMGTDLTPSGPERLLLPPLFPPPAGNTMLVGVDGRGREDAGAFSLRVEEFPRASHGTCAEAKLLELAEGPVQDRGHTFGATDSVSLATGACGITTYGGVPLTPGPDAFYRVELEAGVTYDFRLDGEGMVGALYLFDDCDDPAGSCIAADAPFTGSAHLQFSPQVSGSFLLGVDGRDSDQRGGFTLSIEGHPPPANDECLAAQKLAIAPPSSAPAGVAGSTLGATNAASLPSDGCTGHGTGAPDVFYSLDLEQGKTYVLSVTATTGAFNPAVYLFRSCADIGGTCSEGMGSDADLLPPVGGQATETLVFSPVEDGSYLLAVDGRGLSQAGGPFSLVAAERPDNSDCSAAQPLTPGVKVFGDTSFAGDGVDLGADGCTGYASPGPDLFYTVDLVAGQQYTVKVKPGPDFDPMVYVISDCDAGGDTCQWGSDTIGVGVAESIVLSPASSGTFRIGVDSYSQSEKGPFELVVE